MGGISNSIGFLRLSGQVVRLVPCIPHQLVGETASLRHTVPIYTIVALEVNPGCESEVRKDGEKRTEAMFPRGNRERIRGNRDGRRNLEVKAHKRKKKREGWSMVGCSAEARRWGLYTSTLHVRRIKGRKVEPEGDDECGHAATMIY